MNLTFKTSKSFLLFKRALVLLCLALCSLIANANNTKWTPVYQVKTTSSSRSTGQGKVYVQSGTVKSSEEELSVKEEKTIQLRGSQKTISSSNPDTYTHTFSDITLYAVPADGSTFDGWDEDPTPSKTSVLLESSYTWTNRSGNDVVVEDDYVLPASPKHYHPIFTARTYEAYGQSIGIITLDAEGNVSSEVGGSVSTDGTNWSATPITGGNIVTQPADDQGKKGQATFLPRFYAQPNAGYKLIGWATTPEEAADIYANNLANPNQKPANPYQNPDGIVSTAEQGTGATPPSLGSLYAVFAPSIYYYHLGAAVGIAGDQTEAAAKGRVYADNGEAITTGVAEDKWQISMQDENVYSQENDKVFKYTYYAKVLEPTKVAFKGWTTSPNGEPSYFGNPLVDYEHTVTDDNTAEIKPFRTPTLYAVFESYYYKTPAVAVANNSKGAGFVNVSLTEGLSLDLCTKEEIAASTETHQVPATGTSHAYKVAYYAKNKPGTRFEYWSSTPDGSHIVSHDPLYVEDFETSATNADFPHVAPALYAVFSSDIDIRQQDRMIVYIDEEGNGNINDSKVLIDFQKGKTLTAELTGDHASYFTLSNRSGSKSGSSITFDATQGLIELVVAYKGDLNEAVGKVANITLSATSGGQPIERPVTIVVEEAPIITFLPTDGKGAYKVSMTNGSGINYTMNAATKENIKVPITHESMSNIEIALQSDVDADDYYFFGWQMIDGTDVTYLSYEQLFTYQFTKPVTVRADFVHKDIATYYIVDDPTNTLYHDFALVMSDAKKLAAVNGTQTVMLNDTVRGVQVTKAVLPKGNYTIPTGVQFIVPGKKVRTYREALEQSDYNSSISSFSEYIRWIVEEGTTITVEGGASVSVLANVAVNGASTANGLPYDYGHIELNQNCRMEFLGDSRLFAYGYVTGPESSSILMKDKSLVKETLQAYDWRGGTATSMGYLGGSFKNNKIFLINQYFVQNIEAPLTITAGATEELDAALNVNGIVNMSLTFISQNNGFFQLSNGYSFTKYYDKYSDRIRMTVEKEEGATGTAELGSIALNVTGIGEINSADFVLPLPHNYDIVLGKNTVTNILHDIALLPGATCHIMEGATCNLGVASTANLFIYDQKYSKVDGNGYMGATDAEFFKISSRPDKLQYTRTSATIQDAKLIVDGTLNTPNGYVYTTNYKTETTDHACITSNGGGKVQFNALGTKPDTKQATHLKYGINVVSIPVAPARLLHGNGTYQEPSANTTYTYINDRWTANTAETEKPVLPTPTSYVPVFTVTNYTTSSYVGKSSTGTTTISTNNTKVDWTSTSLTWSSTLYGEHANQFRCTLGAKSSTAVPVTIIFEPKSDGVKTATLRVTATYTYKDTYGVTGKYVYSKDIHLTGNASYLAANTLAFEDLSTLYKGQSGVALFTTGNNTQPITITANPASAVTITGNTVAATIAGNTIGEVTLTATQPADLTNNIAATTITKTIEVNDPVQWNWDVLYLGEQYNTPITMLDSTTGWTLTEAKDDFNIINFQGTAPNYTASVANLIAGSFKIDFTFTQNGKSRPFTSHVIVDPRHLRVDVNNDTVFRAVTLSANEAVYFREDQNGGDGQIVFTSTESSISQWKLGFFGVPDKIYFQAAGANTWQIEESSNGTNWTTSFPWKSIAAKTDFEHSLLPSTRFLRISYGAGNTAPASLSELYITELTDVKADVDKLYIPVQKDADGNVIPYTKEVVFTYANTGELGIGTTNPTFFKLKESTSTEAAGEVVNIKATSEENPFGIMGIEVISTATEEMEGYLEVYEGNTLVLQIPIQTYLFPQELPIKLATDKPDGGDRYYYVTTHTHNAEWDGRDGVRTITLNNAVSDAAPYLIFEFKGNPTYISFNHSNTAKGTWELEQYIDDSWHAVPHNSDTDILANGVFKRLVSATASKLRLIYQSEYAEKVEVTDLVIVGDASAIANPARLELDYKVPEDLTVSAINLHHLNITSTNTNFTVAYNNGTLSSFETTHTLDNTHFDILNGSGMGDIPLQVKWLGSEAIEHGTLELTATVNGETKLLATVELVGVKQGITNGNLGIYTGVAAGYTLAGKYKADGVTLTGKWQGDTHRPVNIDAAFDPNGAALFDYVVVYGETTTSDGSKTINQPNTLLGSNAKTPCYIYKKNGTQYQFHKSVENANSKEKAWNETLQEDMDAVQIPDGQTAVSMYITGFCPYASTGYTKADEGVWYFRADAGDSINVYLQDCYIYSRAKTHDGHSFVDRQDGNSFSSGYSCGSGAVLVFVCNDKDNMDNAMNVTIHTLDSSLLKSNYGCFLQSAAGRAFQVSPAIQIRLINDQYYQTTTTVLNFTDEWPASQHTKTGAGKRTNGFLSLQKQHNNAPSIDMGNARTVVNFNGGQVELQNAQIVSTNYISSMAICHRTGEFAGIPLAFGLGTDGVGGTVNFNDGTTTVLPMEVAANYRQYYLMDTDANGNELATTSCLRTPQNTFVTGGSHCMMRACSSPTSKGGAPKDKAGNDGKLLGLYKFPKNPETGKKGGWTEGVNGLVNVVTSEMDAVNHQVPEGYNVESVTPNNNGTKDNKEDDFLNFWFDPYFEPSAKPEIDMPSSFWKTCMTEIAAQYGGYGGSVGGQTSVAMQNGKQHEEVVNLMYCKIDEYIHTEIRDSSYAAPVKNPAHVGEKYLPVKPSFVGAEIEHYITNEQSFQVKNKVYYITTATADVWNAFTAPFDVKKVYIMETYPEQLLQDMEGTVVGEDTLKRIDIIKEQAKHNADFAAFFAVTVALGQPKDFQTIYSEYIDWAKAEDKASGAWNGTGAYTLRGMSELVPYNGSNWAKADFYLNENVGVWDWNNRDSLENGYFTTTWQFPNASDTILMHQGRTYSMLLPFCTKCGDDINSREYWDYWSGKFLIFESTAGPHTINGSDVLDESNGEGIFATMPNEGEALLKGNSTFAKMETINEDLFTFSGDLQHSTFYRISIAYDDFTGDAIPQTIAPTESFLMSNISPLLPIGTRLRGVTTSGQAIFDVDNSGDGTTTDVHRPTIGGGNSLFITETANGINIAVAEPQHVRVLSSTGVLLYNGMVQNAVDVTLPTAGVYVVAGENEVQKILF